MLRVESPVSFSDVPIHLLSMLATQDYENFQCCKLLHRNKNKVTDGCVPQLYSHSPLHQFKETWRHRPFTHPDNVG